MTFTFAPYDSTPPPPCSGGPRPGLQALMAYLMDRFPWSASYGIYNCRPPSLHSDGRAWDMGIPTGPGGSARPELGMQVVNLLGEHGKRLGLTIMIYNRQKWGAGYPNGKYYGGRHPHFDHIHMDTTEAAARNLTYATCVEVLGPISATPPPAPPPPAPPGPSIDRPTLRVGNRGDHVRFAQERLIAHRHDLSQEGGIDGIFGAGLEREVRAFQAFRNAEVDGVIGQQTWTLLGTPDPPPDDNSRPVLRKGDGGDDVRHLQRRLNAHSPPDRQLDVDGDFGRLTEIRVRQFQTAKGLDVDGVVGSQTWGALR